MTDAKNLTLLAAAAIGIKPLGWHPAGGVQYRGADGKVDVFHPMARDGEAYRLETKLGLSVEHFDDGVRVGQCYEMDEDHGGDRCAARRMAAVKEAADIAVSGGAP